MLLQRTPLLFRHRTPRSTLFTCPPPCGPTQVVGDVWAQLEAEVAAPALPASNAPELLLHMLALQAEGLPAAEVRKVGCLD